MGQPSSLFLGEYRLVERIGEGGMAEVFRAEYMGQLKDGPSGISGLVVVKRIRPELSSQAEFPIFRDMFLNEAKLVKRLLHRNLARVYALEEARDPESGVLVPFIVGEYVKGRDLWMLMRAATDGFRGKGVPPELAAYIVRELALGLGHAHSHVNELTGRPAPIIHRDVSPENVLLSNEGEVKLIDFGVAKALGGFGPQTRTGIIKGKLGYMAPEQVAQRPVPATDVFGAGVVLYELLTGKRLFGGPNEFLVVQRVLKAKIPRPGLRVPVPQALDEVVMRALDRDLTRRYRDGNALAAALTEAMERTPELAGVNEAALVAWMRRVEGSNWSGGPDHSEEGSDLHVNLDQVVQAVEQGRAATPAQSVQVSEQQLFGSLGGTVDPCVHAAVTQALQTLKPEDLASQSTQPSLPPQAPRPSATSLPPSQHSGPPAHVSLTSLPSARSPHAQVFSDRLATVYMRTSTWSSEVPGWAKAVMGALLALVLLLLALLLRQRGLL